MKYVQVKSFWGVEHVETQIRLWLDHENIYPHKINVEREHDGLEDVSPFPEVHSQVPCKSARVYTSFLANILQNTPR